jgi:hypothetical protein
MSAISTTDRGVAILTGTIKPGKSRVESVGRNCRARGDQDYAGGEDESKRTAKKTWAPFACLL